MIMNGKQEQQQQQLSQENIPWFSFDTCAQGQHTQEQSQRQQIHQQHIPSPPSPLHLVSHDYHGQRLDTDSSYHDQRLDTDGAGVLGDSLSSLRDSGLDLPGDDGGSLVVVSKTAGLSSDALKQIVDKGVHHNERLESSTKIPYVRSMVLMSPVQDDKMVLLSYGHPDGHHEDEDSLHHRDTNS